MKPLIILEGPDGAGKTTLAKDSKHLEYIHFGPPPKGKDGAWHQYYRLLEDLWDNPRSGGMIVDRFIYGEMIYGPLLRGGTDLTWAHIRMLERIIMGMSGLLVICLPPYDIIKHNWQENIDDELIKDEADLWAVYVHYQDLLGDSLRMLPRKLHDFTNIHRERVYGSSIFPNKGPGIGLFAPGNVLLVGEQINTKRGKEGWPFVAPDSSSLWLAEQLEQAGIPEHRLYWINSVTNHTATDHRFIDELEPSMIVSLGGKADMWCRHHKLDHKNVTHPQWHKRFRHNEPYPLIEVLCAKI